ncbi:serine hydroxymethyltransferase [Hoyosella sp. YIM 151337]|uniref:serine hydroxymethyltransferase n=1 Tax=Hoyosella sp. YIM 151337 TaxID=2992742 RepID=UPI00223545E3|nr:serine hydroxymethyltransferase [Hoyosella sp. YIM 151337]MCW4355177.1 serine hydroxymethyltransferase [Hoyosella sp. YIM 151337]
MNAPFFGPDWHALAESDPEIAGVILGEVERWSSGLQLIASENVTSPAVLAAVASTLSNKYAEGYPGRRFYKGCEYADKAEHLAVTRAKELFGAEHVNVQPHSGASANLAAYAAFAQPDDPVLALSLAHGGHATHGSRVNFSGNWFTPVSYHVRKDTELIDYDEMRDLARLHRPRMILCGGTAYSRLIDYAMFREIADEIDAILWVDASHYLGLVAGRAVPSPVPYADVITATTHKTLRGPRGGMILCRAEHAKAVDRAVFPFSQGGPMMQTIAAKAVAFREAATDDFAAYARRTVENAGALSGALGERGVRTVSGGTDTHLAVLDLTELGVNGADAESRCAAARILLTKNPVPYDAMPPRTPSGVRVGTAALSAQGFGPADMDGVADVLTRAITAERGTRKGDGIIAEVGEDVLQMVAAKPAYARGETSPAETSR